MSHHAIEEVLASQQACAAIMRGIAESQERIEARLRLIERTIMQTRADFDAALQSLLQAEATRDAAVTKSINDLIAKIAAGTVTTPEDFAAEMAVVKGLQANAASLTQTATADDPGSTDVTGTGGSGLLATVTSLSGSSTATAGVDQSLSVVVAPAVAGGAPPSGTVTLSDANGNQVATGTLDSTGSASLVVLSIPAGSNSYTAAYSGDSTYAASNSAALAIVAS